MEAVVGIEGNDEAKLEDSVPAKAERAPSLKKDFTDPVVYKLVRVEGDGRLVPATDDEVMEVEDMLEDDKIEMRYVADADQTAGSILNDDTSVSSTLNQSKDSEGLLPLKILEVDTKNSDDLLDAAIDSGKLNCQLESISVEECSKSPDGLPTGGSSTSAVCISSKPDFSKFSGEICLENMSVRELHETFNATFGRETSVKDKQWLKRRIAMGLLNSCDVSSTTFFIKDNIVVKKGKEDNCMNLGGTAAEDPLQLERERNDISEGSSICKDKLMENSVIVSDESLRNSRLQYAGEELHMEQTSGKRVRKPTRRYIEELSETGTDGSSGKLLTSAKSSDHDQPFPEAHIRSVQSVRADGRPLVTRQDSLGGCGVLVPYVSRVRRGRPRENFMTLMLAARPEQDKQFLEGVTVELEKDVNLKGVDSCGGNSEGNVVTVTEKIGMRRKHHRPWSLSEVVKLVEGVAQYGAGRWSVIKRLAFSSHSYRTSVDLKDKWRNLLRASFSQLPAEKGIQSCRKHGSIPIPAPILVRVRELAEMQTHVSPNLSSSSFIGQGDTRVHEASSGYL